MDGKERGTRGNNHEGGDDIGEHGAAIHVNPLVEVLSNANAFVCNSRLHIKKHVRAQRSADKCCCCRPVVCIHVEMRCDRFLEDHTPIGMCCKCCRDIGQES